jgi:2-polyprenyl-3-methyl-5-hydroxy-6-metoxy-1,4-benzoquinol methylase
MPRQDDNYAGNAEFWIKIIRKGLDRYRLELTDQAVLEAIGPSAGLRVLDAGCGEGYLSRYIARTAAETCGIDLCSALISAAADERDRQGLDLNPPFDSG